MRLITIVWLALLGLAGGVAAASEDGTPWAACWGLSRTAKTSVFTAGPNDQGTVFDCTSGTFNANLTAAATLGSGWHCTVYNSGSGVVTVDPSGSETIRTTTGSVTTLALAQGQGIVIECNGTGFFTPVTSQSSASGAAGGDLAGTYPNPTVTAARFATPGPIGSGTPSTGAFTTLSATTPLAATSGGTGTATWTLGNLLYGSGTNTLAKLAGNTTIVHQFLGQTGDGVASAAPAWAALVAGDIPGTLGATTFSGNVTMADGINLVVNTTTGTKIGTSTSQKLGFYGVTPVVQQTSTTDLRTALINLGLYATGGASPLNLNGGELVTTGTAATGALTVTGAATVSSTLGSTVHTISPATAASGDTGRVELRELAANGTEAVKLRAPDSMLADTTYTFPSAYPSSSGYVLSSTTSGTLTWTNNSSVGYTGYIVMEGQKATGVNGGSLTSGNWVTRGLTNIVVDTGSHATLPGSSRFQLATGTYRIYVRAPCYKADRNRLALYNASASSYEAYGESAYCDSTISGGVAFLSYRLVNSSAATLWEIRHYAANGLPSGQGVETSDGSTEIYMHIEIYRE